MRAELEAEADPQGPRLMRPDAEPVPAAAPRGLAARPWYPWYVLALVFAVYAMLTLDRSVVTILIEPIKREFHLNDSQMGFLTGMAFAIAYGIAGVPIGMMIDRLSRRWLLTGLLSAWSFLTAVCGFANSYAYLVFARMGVGGAESGGQPISMSLIADYFPPARRALATGVFFASIPTGTLFGFVIAGLVAEAYGWRMAFFIAGVPGLLLAFLIATTLRDPVRGAMEDPATRSAKAASLGETVRFIGTQPALMLMITGTVTVSMIAAATAVWMPSFLIRSHGLSLAEVSLIAGATAGLTAILGAPVGGIVADRVGVRDIRRQPRVAGLAVLVSIPVFLIGILHPSAWVAVALVTLTSVLHSVTFAPAFSLCSSLAPARMRGTVMSFVAVLNNTVGYGVGPQLVGLLSDAYKALAESHSLRWALATVTLVKIVAALAYLISVRTLKRDLARAGARVETPPAAS